VIYHRREGIGSIEDRTLRLVHESAPFGKLRRMNWQVIVDAGVLVAMQSQNETVASVDRTA